jgi:hypothetical protein
LLVPSVEERADSQLRRHQPDQAPREGFLERPAVELLFLGRVQRHDALLTASGALIRSLPSQERRPLHAPSRWLDCGLRPLQGAARWLWCRITAPTPRHAGSASVRLAATAALGRPGADGRALAIGVLVASHPATGDVAHPLSVDRQPAATATSGNINGIPAVAGAPRVLAPRPGRRGLIGEAHAEDADQGTGPQAAQDAAPPGRHYKSSSKSIEAVAVHGPFLHRCVYDLRRWRLAARTAQSPSSVVKRLSGTYNRVKGLSSRRVPGRK